MVDGVSGGASSVVLGPVSLVRQPDGPALSTSCYAITSRLAGRKEGVSDSLRHEPVYGKLAWRWSWHGLRPLHLLAATVPGTLFFGMGSFLQNFIPGLPAWWGLPIAGASLVFIGTLQYRRDRLHFLRILEFVRLPQAISPYMRSRHPTPLFPVSREAMERAWAKR